MPISENLAAIIRDLPEGVELVAAVKTRTIKEIEEAINSGIKVIGENYVQEAEKHYTAIGHRPNWHFIGRLQRNKIKKAVSIFDVIETVDSYELAVEIGKCCQRIPKTISLLIEVNIARESQKNGVLPENATALIRRIADLSYIKVLGLMTMGPQVSDPEELRPYFRTMKKLFEQIDAMHVPGVEMRYLSMGMTNSYNVAISEGANIVRIGTKIFGPRAKT